MHAKYACVCRSVGVDEKRVRVCVCGVCVECLYSVSNPQLSINSQERRMRDAYLYAKTLRIRPVVVPLIAHTPRCTRPRCAIVSSLQIALVLIGPLFKPQAKLKSEN